MKKNWKMILVGIAIIIAAHVYIGLIGYKLINEYVDIRYIPVSGILEGFN